MFKWITTQGSTDKIFGRA